MSAEQDAKAALDLSRREFLRGPVLGSAVVALGLTQGPAAALLPSGGTAPSPFVLTYTGGALSSLRAAHDAFPTDYIEPGQLLGHVVLTWRRPDQPWQTVNTADLTGPQRKAVDDAGEGRSTEYTLTDAHGAALSVTISLHPQGPVLLWTIALRNLAPHPIEVGDLSLPLPMHSTFKEGELPTASVLKHSFVSGSGSFLFWMRSNSVGPFLVLTPQPGTHLEYWDHLDTGEKTPPLYRVYVHSAAKAVEMRAAGGRWRQPQTNLVLGPAGDATAGRQYSFQLAWAADTAGVRDRLVAADLLDIDVVPGMTMPTDLFARFSLRTHQPVHGIDAEFPEHTHVEPLESRNGRLFYQVKFTRLGENLLTIRHGNGGVTRLEFFVTEPLETLLKKRAAFIAAHQHRDPAKWYNGLLAEWNMDSQVLLGPDNYDRIKGWRIYEVTCDDPGLSKPAYLASKNADFPVQNEVAALDSYIEHFVWGGLQRTTAETDSYGIYGILDWKRNRDSVDPGSKGKRHLWRCYDYPHLIVMYFSMYHVAHRFPHMHTQLAADVYLERAYGTALAMFTIPNEIVGWSAYETGFYNEVVIPQLIDELTAVGHAEKAAKLRQHWEKKVQFFIGGKANLFGSEYAFDSTGFESTQALARYAVDHPDCPGITPAATRTFLDQQMKANIFCRGSVEPAYYYLGSDYRGTAGDAFTLSYMSQMGGWAVMDYALHDTPDPYAHLRLGYASYLSTWALVNSGTAQSGYGYWYPGLANDGGAGGGFEPASHGMTWLGQPHHRGSWYYSCESDLGFCGALRSASTVVADDPIFGRFCFGGDLQQTGDRLLILPKDGVRRRFHGRLDKHRLDVEVTGVRFHGGTPIEWRPDHAELRLTLECDAPTPHNASLRLAGLPAGHYRLEQSGSRHTFVSDGASPVVIALGGDAQSFPQSFLVTRSS